MLICNWLKLALLIAMFTTPLAGLGYTLMSWIVETLEAIPLQRSTVMVAVSAFEQEFASDTVYVITNIPAPAAVGSNIPPVTDVPE